MTRKTKNRNAISMVKTGSSDRAVAESTPPKPGGTRDQTAAQLVAKGIAANAGAMTDWSSALIGHADVDLADTFHALAETAAQAHGVDLGDAERLLMAQALTLNAVFVQVAHMAHTTQLVDHMDRYLRLSFKAQGQCRATLETLAALKNPPAVFARQANIAHGPRQVNNGLPRAEEQKSAPTKLMEASCERVDLEPAGQAAPGNAALATVGAPDGPANA